MTTYNETQKSAIAEAGEIIRSDLGLSKNRANWTYEERITYNKRLSNWILSNPGMFPEETETFARDIQATDFGSLEKTGLKANIFAFIDELGNEAEKINPLSNQNRIWTIAAVIGITVGAITLYRFANGKS